MHKVVIGSNDMKKRSTDIINNHVTNNGYTISGSLDSTWFNQNFCWSNINLLDVEYQTCILNSG